MEIWSGIWWDIKLTASGWKISSLTDDVLCYEAPFLIFDGDFKASHVTLPEFNKVKTVKTFQDEHALRSWDAPIIRWFPMVSNRIFPYCNRCSFGAHPPFLDTFLRSYGKSMQISEPADSIMGECSGSNNISWWIITYYYDVSGRGQQKVWRGSG